MALQRNGSDSMPQCKGSLRSRHPTSRLMPTIYMYIYKKKKKKRRIERCNVTWFLVMLEAMP